MVSFLDLPDELILHVAELLSLNDRWNMRLVAKRIDNSTAPILFKTLRSLGPTRYGPELYALLSEFLSHGKQLVFSRYTKKVVILASDSDYPLDHELSWLQLWNNLIPTLINLHSLEWSYWPCEHPVSALVIDTFNSFGVLPNLKELIIDFFLEEPFPGFNLKLFSNLSSLSITWKQTIDISQEFVNDVADFLGRCPNLERFTFCIPRPYHPPDAPSLAHIFSGLSSTTHLKLKSLDVTGLLVSVDDFRSHLHHLLSLKVLRLMFNRAADPPQQGGQICQLLLDNCIYLDELAIDTTHPTSVLNYLSSYSGLIHLEFHSRYPGADMLDGIHHFFSSVIPLHCSTLRELHLGWSIESPWTREIAPDDLVQIEKCQRLTKLCSYVTVAVGPTRRTDKVLVSDHMPVFSVLVYDGAKRMWLEVAMKFPRLRGLILYTTYWYQPTLEDGEYCHVTETSHETEVEDGILGFAKATIEKLTARLVVPFQIIVDSPADGP